MSWVRRVSPGDPAYFCNCPPCPFCFEWVDDDRPRKERKKREGGPRLSFALPVLVGAAFALTVGITMRHQNLSSPTLERIASPPPAAIRRLEPPPQAAVASNVAATVQPTVAPPTAEAAVAPAADPAPAEESEPRQEQIPVRLAVRSSPDTGLTISLRNGTRTPLDLRVTAVDPSSGSQSMVAVNIPALETVDLTRAGLVAEHGYQLRLESPGYVTREAMVQ